MANAKSPTLSRQVSRARLRLRMQSILNGLLGSWIAAILLSAVWFLVQPLVLEQAPPWLRWAVAGSLACLATMCGLIIGWLRTPSTLAAALSIDSRFNLKELVTTSLLLADEQRASPAGAALLEDVAQRIKDLDVGSRFPVKVGWTAALVPVCAGILALIAVFYNPTKGGTIIAATNAGAEPPPNATEIDQKMRELKKRDPDKSKDGKLKSEDLERLQAELEKIANKPRETKEEIRERIKEMTALEETMKQREKEMADKSRSLKSQLQRLDQMSQKDGEGPAKELEKALSEGKFDKVREELERLQKKIAKNELTAKDREQLKKQLENLQKNLDRVAQMRDKEDKLKQANLDPETLKREMDQLKKDSQKLKDLQDLAQQLGQCQKSLKEGDMDGASESLSKAADKAKDMQMGDEDLEDLRAQLSRLQDAKDSCWQGVGEGQGDPSASDLAEDSNNAGIGAGRRPLGKQQPFKSFDSKVKADFNPKGKKIFEGYAPGQSFQKRNGAEIAGEVKQASQEAPEAIEQQRIPKAAREMAKGYFQRMREQADRDQKSSQKE